MTPPSTSTDQSQNRVAERKALIIAALEGIKVITGLGEPLLSQLLTMNLSTMEFRKLRLSDDPNCCVCATPIKSELI